MRSLCDIFQSVILFVSSIGLVFLVVDEGSGVIKTAVYPSVGC